MSVSEKFFDFKDEVKEALENSQPVVVLESTLISHGFPYPENLEGGWGNGRDYTRMWSCTSHYSHH